MDNYIEFIRGIVRPAITLLFTFVVVYLAIKGQIKPEQLLTIYATIMGFWFGARGKKEDK